jgi:hypothetical protein
MSNKKEKTMSKHFVYMEDALWKLLRQLSLLNGCTSHHETGSASEAARKYIKTAIVKINPQLKNIKDIDWNELYI